MGAKLVEPASFVRLPADLDRQEVHLTCVNVQRHGSDSVGKRRSMLV